MNKYEKAYTVAIGNFSIPLTKDQKVVLKELKNMEGFIGVHQVYPRGTLLLFKTENNAKVGRNILKDMGVQVGNNIAEIEYDMTPIRRVHW